MKRTLFTFILAAAVGLCLQAQIHIVKDGSYFKVTGATKRNTNLMAAPGATVYLSDVDLIVTERQNVTFKDSKGTTVLKFRTSELDTLTPSWIIETAESFRGAEYVAWLNDSVHTIEYIPPVTVSFFKAGDYLIVSGLKKDNSTKTDPAIYFFKNVTTATTDQGMIYLFNKTGKQVSKFLFTDINRGSLGEARTPTDFITYMMAEGFFAPPSTGGSSTGSSLPAGFNVIVGPDGGLVLSAPDQSNFSGGAGSVVLGGFVDSTKIVAGASAIIAGSGNTISGNSSFIAAGTTNTVLPQQAAIITSYNSGIGESGSGSVILGGSQDSVFSAQGVIAGGIQNTIQAGVDNAAIVGGYVNTINAERSFIGGGSNNITSGGNSSILGGTTNNTSQPYSTVLGGTMGSTTTQYEIARAGGSFGGTMREAQTSSYIMRLGQTMSTTSWYNFADPDGIGLTLNTAIVFEAQVIGTSQNKAVVCAYKITGVAHNASGTSTLDNSTVTTIYESAANYDCQAIVNDTTDRLYVQVKDANGGGATVRWVTTVSATIVKY